MKVYFIEVGILCNPNDVDEIYSSVYDKKYGYYDENQYYVLTKEEAIKQVNDYVNNGVIGTYGIIQESDVDNCVYQQIVNDDCVEIDETYFPQDVMYSIRKTKNGLESGFIM